MSRPKRAALVLVVLMSIALQSCGRNTDWSSSSRSSAGLAPAPEEHEEAVVLAYRAKVWGFRGIFADHTWLATKAHGADSYTIYEVIGWRLYRNRPALRIEQDVPDRYWFGAEPIPLADFRGPQADALVAKIDDAARRYPYPENYKAFPGPNSNTFTAWVAQEVPELGLDLPARAIGKNYPLDRELASQLN